MPGTCSGALPVYEARVSKGSVHSVLESPAVFQSALVTLRCCQFSSSRALPPEIGEVTMHAGTSPGCLLSSLFCIRKRSPYFSRLCEVELLSRPCEIPQQRNHNSLDGLQIRTWGYHKVFDKLTCSAFPCCACYHVGPAMCVRQMTPSVGQSAAYGGGSSVSVAFAVCNSATAPPWVVRSRGRGRESP